MVIKKSNEKNNTKKKFKNMKNKIENDPIVKEIWNIFDSASKIIKEREKKWERGYRMLVRKNHEKLTNNGKDKDTEDMNDVDKFIISIISFLDELISTRDLVELLNKNSKDYLSIKHKEYKNIIKKSMISEWNMFWIAYLSKDDFDAVNKFTKDENLLVWWQKKIYESFLIYTISLYENFLWAMLRYIINKYPMMLPNDRKLSYEEFIKYTTYDEIQDYYVESYIRTVMWWNCLDQIKEIEKLLKDKTCTLSENIPIKDLVEVSSRRNLYVHNEWKINEQYLKNCKNIWYITDKKLWEYLSITQDYFNNCFYLIYEATLKIAYLIFCKCTKDEKELYTFDWFFNQCCINLIDKQDNSDKINLWLKLFEFGYNYTIKNKEHWMIYRWLYVINIALCYKMKWDKKACEKFLKKEDRSVASPDIRLAIAVLHEDWTLASKIMEIATIVNPIKAKDEERNKFEEKNYRERPIFFEFRKTKEFQKQYKKIFKKDYIEE